jgi:hypothetical protein
LTPDVKEPFQSPSFKKSSATDSPQLFDLETTQPATYCIWEYYKRSSEDSLHKNLTVLRGNPSQDENSRFTLSLMQLMKALTAALRNSCSMKKSDSALWTQISQNNNSSSSSRYY